MRKNLWAWLIAGACVAWHIVGIAEGWRRMPSDWAGDFASYHYAVQVARDGGNPYDRVALGAAAREDGYRHTVFPFVYPPFALPLMAWTTPLTIATAFRAWFAFNYLFAGWIGFVLWRWWAPRDAIALPLIVASLAALHPVQNGLFQGQTNLLVLALTLTALWQAERRPTLGGILLACAIMVKVVPVLFVGAWAVERRARVVVAVTAAVPLLAIVALPWAGLPLQLDYALRILPALSGAGYAAVDVPVTIFGNWSPAALFARAFPSDSLAPAGAALALARLVALAVIAVIASLVWSCRHRGAEPRREAAQAGAIAAGLLLVPAYTFEHHLVWVIPGLVALGLCVWNREHGKGLWGAYVVAWLALAVPLQEVRRVYGAVSGIVPLDTLVRHVKLGGVLIVLAACTAIAFHHPKRNS